eukprot:g2886.t1
MGKVRVFYPDRHFSEGDFENYERSKTKKFDGVPEYRCRENGESLDIVEAEAARFVTETTCTLVLFVALVWTYRRILSSACEFTNFDDDVNFVENDRIHYMTDENLRWMVREGQVLGVYEPVANLFKTIVGRVFRCTRAFGDGAASYHATVILRASFVLHFINSLFCVLLSNRLLLLSSVSKRVVGSALEPSGVHRMRWVSSTLATLAISANPLRVESVAWASAQPYLLATTFSVLACAAHVEYRTTLARHEMTRSDYYLSSRGSFARVMSLIFIVLASLSKAPAIVLPGAFVCFDWWFEDFRVENPSVAKEKAVSDDGSIARRVVKSLRDHSLTLLVSIGCFAVAYGPSQTQGMRLRDISRVEVLTRALHAPARYVGQTFFPTNLTVYYAVPDEPMMPWSSRFRFSVLVTIVLSIGAVFVVMTTQRSSLRLRAIAYSWVAYVSLLLPTLGVVSKHIWGLAADRYCHIPLTIVAIPLLSAGLRIVLNDAALFTTRTAQSAQHVVLCRGFLVGWLAWILLSVSRSAFLVDNAWVDSEALWRYTTSVCPRDAFVLNNLASTIGLKISSLSGEESDARLLEAVSYYDAAIRESPDHMDALVNAAVLMGSRYHSDDMHRSAEKYAMRAVSIEPDSVDALHALALVRHAALSRQFLQSGDNSAPGVTSSALKITKAVEDIEELYRAALVRAESFSPGQAKGLKSVSGIQNNLALLLGNERVGRFAEAASLYRSAAQDRQGAEPALQYALALQRSGVEHWPDAIEAFKQVLRQNPDHIATNMHLAGLLGDSQHIAAASWHYQKVLSIEPHNAGALCGVGAALAAEGRLEEAIGYFERCTREDGSYVSVVGEGMIVMYGRLGLHEKKEALGRLLFGRK